MKRILRDKDQFFLCVAAFITLVLFTAILSVFLNDTADKLQKEEAIIKSFKSSGAEFQKAVISCCLKLNEDFMTANDVEHQVNKIVEDINPDKNTIIKKLEIKQNIIRVNVTCKRSNKSYNICVESAKTGEKAETYMIVDTTIEKNLNDLAYETIAAKKIYGKNFINTDISVCIAGYYNDRLNASQIKRKIASVLKQVNGKKVEALESYGVNSISAFSNKVDGYIKSGGKNINMQVALRYSPLYNKTYIWIGTPLINVEY